MRKIFTLLSLALLATVSMVKAQTFQIATCSAPLGSSTYGPMYSVATAGATNRTATIYPSPQLANAAGQITNVYYNRVTASGMMAGTPNLKIYFKEVSFTDWGSSALDWNTAIAGATLVFDGDPAAIVGSTAGWKNFPLMAPFDYSGSQNLAVFTEYTNATASTAITWSYEYTNPCINTANDNTTKYSNVTSGVLPTSLASEDYRRALIAFDVNTLNTCVPPTGISTNTVTTSGFNITWTAPASAPTGGYEFYVTSSPLAPSLSQTPTGTTGAGVTNATVGSLSSGILHYVYVRSVCGADKSNWQVATLIFTLPSNDECSQAIPLTVSPLGSCNSVAGTTQGSTSSSSELAPACSATGINDDVWYSFVATAGTHTISLINTTSTAAAAVYSGSCGALVSAGCASTNTTVSSLTIGNTYYVRVYTTSTTATVFTAFNICVTTPPVNDECAGATSMPVTIFGSACNYTAVSTVGALLSTTTGQANSCTTTGINDDVWYTFTTGSAAGIYTLSYTNLTAVTGTAASVGVNVYTGACGALTIVPSACSSGFGTGGIGSFEVTLAASTTYTIRLWVGSTANSGTFNFCITSPVPPPPNDNCAGAISLTSSATGSCVTATAGTTIGATQSPDAAPTCSATGINDDVWYSFTATSTSHTILLTNTVVASAAAIYTGSCGTLSQLGNSCTSEGTSSNALVIGTTYYVRVYSTSATSGTDGTFDICIVTNTPPVNDDCGGAVSLTPSATVACVNPVAGTTAGSTPSVATASTCSATGANDDVWYSFVATSGVHTVLITAPSTTTATSIYSGACGSLTLLGCGSGADGSAIATGLAIGTTYYVRVYSTSTTEGTISNFNICVVSSPSNDECSGALALTPSAGTACVTATSGTTLGSTSSLGELAPGCSATGINDDVWYSFVATATTHTVALLNSTTTTAAQVYSGSCGALSLVANACASTNLVAAGLTIGNTYYVRVYSTSATAGLYSVFDICIGVLPSNDDCANPINLTAAAGATCNAVAGSTVGATASTGTTPTCSATGINDDVWYSFTATNTTHIVQILDANTTTAASVYSGACGGLVEVGCASTTNTVTGLTIGNLYYVRVYSTTSTATTFTNFNICISGPPANDNCANATVLTTGVSTNGSTAGASQSQAPETCGTATGSSAVDVWYQFTATAASQIVTVNNVAAGLDAVVMVYSGTCGSLINIGCADGPAGGGTETVTLNSLVIGQNYYLRVYGFTSTTGSFSVVISAGAVPVSIEYFNGSKQNNGATHLLQWKVNCSNTPSATMILERSANQVNFEPVHSINATAQRCLQPFSYVHGRPLGGTNYYRLKTIDADGKVAYSSIIAILHKARGLEIVSMMPNPVQRQALLSISSATASRMQLIVTDIAGRQLETRAINLVAGSNQVSLNFAKLASGVYYLMGTSDDGDKQTIKFVKE